jgi:hypothetical protein
MQTLGPEPDGQQKLQGAIEVSVDFQEDDERSRSSYPRQARVMNQLRMRNQA